MKLWFNANHTTILISNIFLEILPCSHTIHCPPHSHTSHSRDFGCHRIGRLVSQSGPMRPTCQTWARLSPRLAGSNLLGLQNLAPTFSHLPPFVIQKRFCLPLVYKFVFPLRERISPFFPSTIFQYRSIHFCATKPSPHSLRAGCCPGGTSLTLFVLLVPFFCTFPFSIARQSHGRAFPLNKIRDFGSLH